MKGTEYFVSL